MNDQQEPARGRHDGTPASEGAALPLLVAPSLSALLRDHLAPEFQDILANHIRRCRWFRGKARQIGGVQVLDRIPLRETPDAIDLVVVRISYMGAEAPEIYVLPMASRPGATGTPLPDADALLFNLRPPDGGPSRVVYDPSSAPELPDVLLDTFLRPLTLGDRGRLRANPTEAFASRLAPGQPRPAAQVSKGEQSNTTMFFGREFMLKLFRQMEAGENPDVEITEFLWRRGYRHVPEPLGTLSYEGPGFAATLGLAQRFVPSEGTAWDVTVDLLERSCERARSAGTFRSLPPESEGDVLDASSERVPPAIQPLIEPYAELATLLGVRTAELHVALASDPSSPGFAPEPFTSVDVAAMVGAARDRVGGAFDLLSNQLSTLPDHLQALARKALAYRSVLEGHLDALESREVHARKIRCHGDYHLGQVLYGAGAVTILDFEGEPAQTLDVRRRKRSALYDVCGMIRSFHYAATLARQGEGARQDDPFSLQSWTEAWYHWTSARFLRAYLDATRDHPGGAAFVPSSTDELRMLIRLHLIEKCSYELAYELNNRPAWVGVPMAGLLSLAQGR